MSSKKSKSKSNDRSNDKSNIKPKIDVDTNTDSSSIGGAEVEQQQVEQVEQVEKGNKLNKSNIPIIVEIPKLDSNIFETNQSVTFSTNIDYPRSEYGFHHFIHNNKNKLEKLKVFEDKKKVYLVFDRFERNIDKYDKSINIVSKEFFEPHSKIGVLSNDFYGLWEILLMFNLIDITQDKFVSAHLSESIGSFVQATILYRDSYCKKSISKNDKYYTVTIHPNDADNKNNASKLDKTFVDYYQKEKPQRFILHQTYSKKQSGGSKTKDNGDITDPKTIKLFGGQMEEKADLITGDISLNSVNENVQEQEALKLIIAQIVSCVKLQKKGGNFVCKFFETFTRTTVKIISILSSLYDKIYFVKPLTSKLSNSEKYAVCIGFKFSDKDKEYKDISKKLDELLKSIHDNANNKIVDIFSEYNISKKLIRSIIELNKELSNQQLKSIGEIISYVDKEIYSGDEYHDKREEQIEGANYWNKTFLPTSENLNKNKKEYELIIKTALDVSNKEIENLNKLLSHVENQN